MRVDCVALASELRPGSSPVEAAEIFESSDVLWSLQPSGLSLAAARGNRLCLVTAGRDDETASPRHTPVAFSSSHAAPVTSICWATFRPSVGSLGRANEDCCLLVGTSTGFLYLVALDGRVLQRQRLHNRPLTSIRCRAAGMGIDPLDPLEDITIMADNAFMRLRAIELLSVLRGHRVGSWTAADSPVLSIDKWRLPRSVGPRTDAFCAGTKPPGLYNTLTDSEDAVLCIHTAGENPAMACLDAKEVDDSLLGAAAKVAHALSSRVTQVQSTISSVYNSASIRGMYQLAKTAVVGSPPVAASDSGLLPPEDTSGDVPVGETCRVWRTLTDPARAVSAILPSPSGGLLVAMDQLGRILMLDSPSFLVLRVWKGYRDAMCGWAELPADPSAGGGSSSSSASTDVVLCLAIYAPRKSLVEIWQVAGHVRRCAFSCSPGCRLIQPEVAFGSQAAPDGRLLAPVGRQTCFMMDQFNGLVDIAQHARSALGI